MRQIVYPKDEAPEVLLTLLPPKVVSAPVDETGREGCMRGIESVTDCHGRVWRFDSQVKAIQSDSSQSIFFDLGGKWLHDGKEASGVPDKERALREGTLCGDPMIAGNACNYPRGVIIDYFCLACGSTFAAHDEYSECWRMLKTEEELKQYDDAMEIANRIRGY